MSAETSQTSEELNKNVVIIYMKGVCLCVCADVCVVVGV